MSKRIVAFLASVILLAAAIAGCSSAQPTAATQQPSASAVATSQATPQATQQATPQATQQTTPQATTQATKAGPVTLTYFFGETGMMDWFNTYFAKYTKENDSGITVETEYSQQATNVLQVKAAAGDMPDLMSLGLPQQMIDQGYFLDLTNESWWSSLIPAAKELSTDVLSGKHYFIPLATSAVGIFYNKDMFNELGLKPAKTWDEFVSNLETIKEKKPGVCPFFIGGKDAFVLAHLLEFNVDGVPKQLLGYAGFEKACATNDLATLGWNDSPDGVVATYAKLLMDLQTKKLINDDVVTATYDNQVAAFVTGKAAVMHEGIWALAEMKKKNPDFKAIGFCAYPSFMSGVKNTVGTPLDCYVTISASSKHIDAAKQILGLMLQPDSIKSLCEQRGSIPANPSVDANWSVIKDDVSAVIKDSNIVGESWTQNLPGAFNDDERGKLVQELFVGKYATSTDFAKEYLKRWTDAYNTAHKK